MELSIAPVSKASRRAGWIISGILIAFYLADGIMKIMMESHSVKGSADLGWPVSLIPGIGVALVISTALYAVPKTMPIGTILITGYLGGAMSIMLRAGVPIWFTIAFALLTWTGAALRDPRIKRLFI